MFKNSSERRERDFFIPLVQYHTEVFVFYINVSSDTTNLICKYRFISVPMIKDVRDVEQSVNNNKIRGGTIKRGKTKISHRNVYTLHETTLRSSK